MIFLYSAAVSLTGGTGSEKLTTVPPSVEIFHHADEPFGVVVDAAEKLLFLPVRKVVVFQKRDRRAGDCRKGRAQIVRNRPQEIGAHALGLCLHADALLPLERRRQRVDRE